MKNIILPENVKLIIDTIENKGYEAWCVGGCVRDILMNKKVNDYDIASNCPAIEIFSMFDKVIDTGLKHGTVTVVLGDENYEITQYRIDGEYLDSRHPENLTFTNSFRVDLSRRDFTMNAIGYHYKRGIYDPFGGRQAIDKKTIVAVGEPDLRFKEDALRILRAFRFSSVLNFSIEENTKRAALNNKHLLNNISKERIREELFKLLSGENLAVLSDLFQTDLSKLNQINNNLIVRFCALCILLNKNAYDVAIELKTDRKQRKLAGLIFDALIKPYPESKTEIKKNLSLIPQNMWEDVLQAQAVLKNKRIKDDLLKSIVKNNEPYLINHLDLSAEDKKQISKMYSGEQTKILFEKLVDEVIKNPQNNKNKILKELITQIGTNS
ncbi:MAG: hypothetical protein UHN02_00785 [Acutalibacteraceae bacterium]|nr:hypothetical protein [Acutalibacteraceae bacterium]